MYGARPVATPHKSRWTILEVLDWTRGHFQAKGLENPRLDAEVIIAHVLGIPRIMLYARFDQPLVEEERAHIRELVARRARREPIAYLTGHREFFSLDMEVNRNVLVPRPDTELLVELTLSVLEKQKTPRVADVGSGSGCIAIAIAAHHPGAQVYGLELSSEALVVARRNAEALGVSERVRFEQSDLFAGLPAVARPVDAVIANLPYIPSHELEGIMQDVRDHEPRLALDGGPDGLALIRRLIETTPAVLSPTGFVALEAGPQQVPVVAELLKAAGLGEVECHTDLAGHARVASGRRMAA